MAFWTSATAQAATRGSARPPLFLLPRPSSAAASELNLKPSRPTLPRLPETKRPGPRGEWFPAGAIWQVRAVTSGVAREPPEEERRRGCGCGGGGGRARGAAVPAAGGAGRLWRDGAEAWGGLRPEGGRRGRKRQRWLHGPSALRDPAFASARRRPNNEAPEANLGQPQW